MLRGNQNDHDDDQQPGKQAPGCIAGKTLINVVHDFPHGRNNKIK